MFNSDNSWLIIHVDWTKNIKDIFFFKKKKENCDWNTKSMMNVDHILTMISVRGKERERGGGEIKMDAMI